MFKEMFTEALKKSLVSSLKEMSTNDAIKILRDYKVLNQKRLMELAEKEIRVGYKESDAFKNNTRSIGEWSKIFHGISKKDLKNPKALFDAEILDLGQSSNDVNEIIQLMSVVGFDESYLAKRIK